MGKKQLLAPIMALLSLTGPTVSVSATRALEVDRRDDAYHYAYFSDGLHDANYIEWWYFNLFDRTQDIQVAITYAILDPANLSGAGLASVQAFAFAPSGSFTEGEIFPVHAFSASYEQADVVITSADPIMNSVTVIDDRTYHVVGSVKGTHSVAWDLVYVREASPWLGADRQHIGILPWEQMSWLVYMPGAVVTGEVTIDDHTYQVTEARGYHDHNWGEWVPFTVAWNWAQYFEPGFAIAIGDFRASPAGVVSVDLQDERTVFTKDQYRVVHTRWAYDAVNDEWFPVTTWVVAENERSALVIRLRALLTEPLLPPPEIPLPLVPIIYEQTVEVAGAFWKKHGGEWELSATFQGGGFREYTDLKWAFCTSGSNMTC